KRFVRGRSAVGLRMEQGAGRPLDLQIVGVVEDIRNLTLREAVNPSFFLPYEQFNVGAKSIRATFFVRSANSADRLTSTARSMVAQLESALPVFNAATMQTRIEDS